MYDIFFIGNDIYNLFPNIFHKNMIKRYNYFPSANYFIASEDCKKLFSNVNTIDIIDHNILICDKSNLLNLENNSMLKFFKTVYVYEDIYEILLTTFNKIKHIHEKNYYDNYDFNYLNTRLNLLKEDTSTKILITGLSYAMMGLDENLLKYKGNNLSLSSQDLYYSYKLSKEVISSNKNIKYCIIGLCYYSLHFDLSLSGEAALRINSVYYPLLKDSHHFTPSKMAPAPAENVLDNYLRDDLKQIFNTMEVELYFKNKLYKDLSEIYFSPKCTREALTGTYCYISQVPENQRENLGSFRGTHHNNFIVHTLTVDENANILGDFLHFLNENNVKPILCIFPSTYYYNKYFSKDFSTIFYNHINNFKNLYDFSLLDFNDFDDFILTDFIDADHLNYNGAIKATNILNNYID